MSTTRRTTSTKSKNLDPPETSRNRLLAAKPTSDYIVFIVFGVIFIIAAIAVLVIWLILEFSNTTIKPSTREQVFLGIILVIFAISGIGMLIFGWRRYSNRCYTGNFTDVTEGGLSQNIV